MNYDIEKRNKSSETAAVWHIATWQYYRVRIPLKKGKTK